MKPRTEEFHALAESALQNQFLRKAISRANVSFQDSRSRAVEELRDWEELRVRGSAIKRRALDHLPWALEAFEKAIVAQGGRVHWAEDAARACELVVDVARRHGVTRVIKSKSMVTEEVALNEKLEEAGLVVTESDLGEYIAQLAGERPSHIVAPVIHKSRHEIAKLLSEKLGSAPDADIPEMTQTARMTLREQFFKAEMGVSGANFAVAETGTLVIVENEGNARLTTTLPPLHVALVGIEKVVPGMRDLAVLLRLLCRSATGQKISSYVSFIRGARTSTEPDGPEELHVILLDNGRSRIWADPRFRQALHCIRCGACLNYCPVYERIGGHAYGWVYPGPIGSVITPQFVGLVQAKALPQASSLCGRCAEVCPVKIPLPEQLLDLRAEAVRREGGPRGERLAMRLFSWLVRSPRAWRLSLWLVRPVLLALGRFGLARRLPGPVRLWSRRRELPVPGKRRFRTRWRQTEGFRS